MTTRILINYSNTFYLSGRGALPIKNIYNDTIYVTSHTLLQ